MSTQKPPTRQRDIRIADHLFSCLERMASELAADRDGLMDQAMSMFARSHGYLTPRRVAPVAVAAAPARGPTRSPPATDDAARQAVAARVLDTAAEFERQLKDKKR